MVVVLVVVPGVGMALLQLALAAAGRQVGGTNWLTPPPESCLWLVMFGNQPELESREIHFLPPLLWDRCDPVVVDIHPSMVLQIC